MIKEFEDRVNSHKKGLEELEKNLVNSLDDERSKNAKLKAIAAKTGPKGTAADKEKKCRPKRDTNKNNKNNKE